VIVVKKFLMIADSKALATYANQDINVVPVSTVKVEGNEFCRFSLVTHWDDNTGSVLFTWDYLWLPEFTDFQSIFISKRVEKATISEHKIHMIGKCIGD
jgi:hypothetical protein